MNENPNARTTRVWPVATALLTLHLLLAAIALKKDSAVADEPFHIARAAGLVFFRDATFAVSHPPLVNFLEGLPLLSVRGLKLPAPDLVLSSRAMDPSDRRNAFASLLLDKLNPDAKKLIERARWSTVVLSLLLGLGVFLWAKKLYGPSAGLVALMLYSLDPNILAHSHLATNDLGAALFIFLAIFFMCRLWQKPGLFSLLLASLFLGLAELAKFSAILLYPLYPLLWLLLFASRKGQKPESGWFSLKPPELYLSLWSLAFLLLGSLLVIWAGYGFETGLKWNFSPLLKAGVCGAGQLTARIKCQALYFLAWLPLPPRTFYYGLARTLVLTEQHENALYFLGRSGDQGWWYYYPLLFLVKTPLPLLLLVCLRLAWNKKIPPINFSTRLLLAVPPLWFFLFFTLLNRKEIGIRHLLMVYPFLLVLVSGLAADMTWSQARKQLTLLLLLAWFVLSSLFTFPHFLTYFSEAVGRKAGGLKISVVGEDWGQDVSSLAEFQKRNNLYPLYYQPYVLVNPRAYGLDYQDMSCEPLKPGTYAIHLTQLKRPVRNPSLRRCAELLGRVRPAHKINGTIWVWEIPGTSSASPGP